MIKVKFNRTLQELKVHLDEQIKFLENSINLYDQWDENEFKRIATVIRTLVHDTKTSVSLLWQIGTKKWRFYSTCNILDFSWSVPQRWLIVSYIGQWSFASDYYPALDDFPVRRITFEEWWNELIFIKMEQNGEKITISRKELILAVANSDWGAHVGLEVEEAYLKLSKHHLLGDMKILGANLLWEKCKNPERATVRQIWHEILKTLHPKYKKERMFSWNGFFIGNFRIS